jgi:competence protein CoiA
MGRDPGGPGDGWRADVLAVSPDGHERWAWEVQLSGLSVAAALARTEAMRASGVSVCWLTDQEQPVAWFGKVPSIRIRAAE